MSWETSPRTSPACGTETKRQKTSERYGRQNEKFYNVLNLNFEKCNGDNGEQTKEKIVPKLQNWLKQEGIFRTKKHNIPQQDR